MHCHFEGKIFAVVSVLPMVDIFTNFDANLLVGITITLVVLPLLIFIIMSLMINKENIKRLPRYFYTKCTQLHVRTL